MFSARAFVVCTTASLSFAGPCGPLESDTDFTGNDIRRSDAKTPEACCADCAATPSCGAWTLWQGGPSCYLKYNASGRSASTGHVSATVTNPLPPPPDFHQLQNATDCLMRRLFVQFGASVNPNIDAVRAQQMAEALRGDPIMGAGCVIDVAVPPPSSGAAASPRAVRSPAKGKAAFFVDAARGDDGAAGTEAAPFRTVPHAVAAVRAAQQGGGTVTMRAGVYRLSETLVLGPADAGLTLTTHTDDTELAWLSGAVPLGAGITWKPVDVTDGVNVWSADLSAVAGLDVVPALRLGGRRLWRARFPNGDPERSFPFAVGLKAESWATTPGTFPPYTTYVGPVTRNDTVGTNTRYTMGSGSSSCDKYTPKVSHYCRGGSDAGGGAVISGTTLPNQPYKNPAGATITAMHGGLWCSFMYRVGDYFWQVSHGKGEGHFAFTEGGQQCNRAEGGHGELLVEGVREELDEPNEFHFDVATRVLTLWHNASSGTAPPTDGSLEVVQLSTLINATGTQNAPVASLTLDRVGLRDTSPSAFAPHMAPTGGDWAVNRAAALSVTGATGLGVHNSTFWRLDNAGIFLGGFHRNATIADNEFAWLGESAIVSVGDTDGMGAAFPGFGDDGTAGNQPRGSAILRNYARELGIVNKQSAMYFQAATDGATLIGNIAFNGARSGINFNDAFGSGSRVERNVLFNLNRETADHGCFNAWDRLPFLPAKDAAHRDELHANLLLSNFNRCARVHHS